MDVKTGKRVYITKKELKNIVNKNIFPKDLEYLKKVRQIQSTKNARTNEETSQVIHELRDLLENPNTIVPCKRFYLKIDSDILKQMKILLGPKVTPAQEDIVKLIVKEYCPDIKISRSKLKIC